MATTTTSPAALPLDPAVLQRVLDGPHAATRDRVRAWLAEPGHVPRPDLELEPHREQVLAWAREMADAGITGRGYPREFGGEDDIAGWVAGFETTAFGDLSLLVKCGVQFGLFGGAVFHLGTRRHHERYLADILSLHLPGCFAMTESGHGSNVAGLRTTATYDAATREFVITTPDDEARKDYIGNAARDGRMAAVFAQLIVDGEEHGVHALLVPIRDDAGRPAHGVRIEDCGMKLGLDGVDNGRLWFDGVSVPREALLDRYGTVTEAGEYESPIENPDKRFFTMLGTLVQGRVSVGGAAINATKVAQAIAVRHAEERRQFGPADGREVVLMDYRTHQRRLLPDVARTYGLHFAQAKLVEQLAWVFSEDTDATDRDRRKLETMAAGLKAVGTWHATKTIQECREACGGAGYLKANRFAALKADTDVFTTFEGDNTVLLQLAAKNLLTEYRDTLGELDPLGTATFFAGQVLGVVVEHSAIGELLNRIGDALPGVGSGGGAGGGEHGEDEGDFLDRKTQLGLLRWREEHVLGTLGRRMKGGIDAGADPFDTLIDCQDHLVLAGRVHVEALVLDAFAEAVEACADAAAAARLDKLCTLYALSTIEADRGWFQEHGRISSTRSKALIKAVNALCGELRPEACLFVDAFGVPQAALGDAEGVAEGEG